MITIGNYSLLYDKQRNKITICLPQTVYTPTNTLSPVEDRLVDLPEKDLASVLLLVKYIFDGTIKINKWK